jgi:hypothetical protein
MALPAPAAPAAGGDSLLEIELQRLRNSVAHLESSVLQLKAALADAPGDLDFRQALSENIVVIAKHKARIEALEALLSGVAGGGPDAARSMDVDVNASGSCGDGGGGGGAVKQAGAAAGGGPGMWM